MVWGMFVASVHAGRCPISWRGNSWRPANASHQVWFPFQLRCTTTITSSTDTRETRSCCLPSYLRKEDTRLVMTKLERDPCGQLFTYEINPCTTIQDVDPSNSLPMNPDHHRSRDFLSVHRLDCLENHVFYYTSLPTGLARRSEIGNALISSYEGRILKREVVC